MTRHGTIDAQMDELGTDPGQVGPDSAGQSGDAQGLSEVADAANESVEDLADTGQPYEAGVIEGVEDAADHPERPVPTHATREERIGRVSLGVPRIAGLFRDSRGRSGAGRPGIGRE